MNDIKQFIELDTKLFRKLLNAVSSSNINWKDIAFQLAETNPELFLELVNSNITIDWETESNKLFKSGTDRVTIIRYVTENSNMGMKESRDWVDKHLYKTNISE
jgi:hypothetical protein